MFFIAFLFFKIFLKPLWTFNLRCLLSKYLRQLLTLLSVHRRPIVILAPAVAVGPLQAAALLCGTGCLAVRTDLEVDVALDLILTLEEVIRGIHF